MGAVSTKIWLYLIEKPEMLLLLVCWDADGKATIPYKLRGKDKIRPIWPQYYQGTNGLICIVGGKIRDRIEDAREELNTLMNADTGDGLYEGFDRLSCILSSEYFGFGVQSVQGS